MLAISEILGYCWLTVGTIENLTLKMCCPTFPVQGTSFMTVSEGVPCSLPLPSSYTAFVGTTGECLHTGEEILTLTQNQLSEATETHGHGPKGRGQSFPGRSSSVIQTSGGIDRIGFFTEKRNFSTVS